MRNDLSPRSQFSIVHEILFSPSRVGPLHLDYDTSTDHFKAQIRKNLRKSIRTKKAKSTPESARGALSPGEASFTRSRTRSHGEGETATEQTLLRRIKLREKKEGSGEHLCVGAMSSKETALTRAAKQSAKWGFVSVDDAAAAGEMRPPRVTELRPAASQTA